MVWRWWRVSGETLPGPPLSSELPIGFARSSVHPFHYSSRMSTTRRRYECDLSLVRPSSYASWRRAAVERSTQQSHTRARNLPPPLRGRGGVGGWGTLGVERFPPHPEEAQGGGADSPRLSACRNRHHAVHRHRGLERRRPHARHR